MFLERVHAARKFLAAFYYNSFMVGIERVKEQS